MNSDRRKLILFVCLALGGGVALAQLGRAHEPAAAARRGPAALGPLSGGLGVLAADWLWLETNVAWERRDAAETRQLVQRTVTADPQSVYFWLNGARMLAYDLPAWRCEGEPDAPAEVRRRWRQAGAAEAVAFLERGLAWHEHSASLYLELANLSYYAQNDRRRAAAYYRRAAACPDAPAYAARLAHVDELR